VREGGSKKKPARLMSRQGKNKTATEKKRVTVSADIFLKDQNLARMTGKSM